MSSQPSYEWTRRALCIASIVAVIAASAACGTRSTGRRPARAGLPEGPLPLGELLAMFPADTAAVAGLDLEKVRASVHFQTLFAPYLGTLSVPFALPRCLIEHPATAIVLAVGADPRASDRAFAAVTLPIPRKQVHACLRQPGDDMTPIEVETAGVVTRYRSGDRVLAVRWVSEQTFITAAAMEDPRPLAALGQERNLRGNAAVMSVIDLTHTDAMVWFAGDVSRMPGLVAEAQLPVAPPDAVYGWGNLLDALDAELHLRFASAGTARSAAQTISEQIDSVRDQPFVGGYLRGVAVAQSDADVEISVRMSRGDFESVLSLVKTMGLLPDPR